MKTTITINGKSVEIELTEEQLAEIRKQTADYKDLDTFEKILEFKGESLEQFNKRTEGMEPDEIGYQKCKAIVWALNGGKHLKEGYFPWFRNPNRSSVGFSYRDYGYDDDFAFVSACLLLEDPTLAEFAGNKFPKEYSLFINATFE